MLRFATLDQGFGCDQRLYHFFGGGIILCYDISTNTNAPRSITMRISEAEELAQREARQIVADRQRYTRDRKLTFIESRPRLWLAIYCTRNFFMGLFYRVKYGLRK